MGNRLLLRGLVQIVHIIRLIVAELRNFFVKYSKKTLFGYKNTAAQRLRKHFASILLIEKLFWPKLFA